MTNLKTIKYKIRKLFDGDVTYSEKLYYSHRFPEQEKFISIKKEIGLKMYVVYNHTNMVSDTWIGKLGLDQPGYFSRKINEITIH